MGVIAFAVKKPASGGIDQYTVLMLHGDESPLVDSSLSPQTLNLAGGVARNSSESKFGGYSIYTTDSDKWVSIQSPGSEFNWGIQDMTYDFWFKHSGANVWQWFHGGPTSAVWTADSTWTIPGSTPGSLYWATGVTHTPAYDEVVWSNANLRSDTNWNHIALVKYGSLHMMFVNGVKQTRTVDIGVQVPAFNAVDFFVGRSASDPGDGCTAYMDEVRLSVGKARWTENFTPPVAPYFYNG